MRHQVANAPKPLAVFRDPRLRGDGRPSGSQKINRHGVFIVELPMLFAIVANDEA
jgi:hypothetical protein